MGNKFLELAPKLPESEISRICAMAAESLSSDPFNPKSEDQSKDNPRRDNPKSKKLSKEEQNEFYNVLSLKKSDPRRMEGIRKFALIYGRFDAKRRDNKPLTLHEVRINEVAVQLCNLEPAFLIHRADLFTRARKVLKDCNFPPSAESTRFAMSGDDGPSQLSRGEDHEMGFAHGGGNPAKRTRLATAAQMEHQSPQSAGQATMMHDGKVIHSKCDRGSAIHNLRKY